MRGQGRGRSPKCPKTPPHSAKTGAAMPLMTGQDFARRSGTISNTRLGFVKKTHTSEVLKMLILRPELSSAHLRCGINNGIGHG